MPPAMQRIILVRHGFLDTWGKPTKARGTPPHERIDPGLSELGRRQAGAAAAHIATGGGATAVLCSPFRRCLETADAIAAACSAPVSADWRLGEVLISTVLGVPFSPTAGMDPDWVERRAGAGKPAHPESDRTVQERVAKTVNDLKVRKPFAESLVIVSHDIILKALVGAMTGRTVTVDWHPCAIATLVREKPVDRTWKLRGELAGWKHLGADDASEPVEQIVHRYHPNDSRS